MSASDTPAISNARRAAFELFGMATAFRARAEVFAPAWNRAQADQLDAAGTEAVRAVRSLLRRAAVPFQSSDPRRVLKLSGQMLTIPLVGGVAADQDPEEER